MVTGSVVGRSPIGIVDLSVLTQTTVGQQGHKLGLVGVRMIEEVLLSVLAYGPAVVPGHPAPLAVRRCRSLAMWVPRQGCARPLRHAAVVPDPRPR
jgi:hypothetical protein